MYMINNKLKDVFTKNERAEIYSSINKELSSRETVEWDDASMGGTHKENLIRIKRKGLGRLEINNLPLPNTIIQKIFRISQQIYQLDVSYPKNISGITYVEYNPKYGEPVLNVHKDNGTCGLILDYQLESNTSWEFGVEKTLYTLEDNELIAMYPITHYHWRPKKVWNEGEYIKLIFFEFFTPKLEKVEDENLKNEIINFSKEYLQNEL